jgi:membrane protease YdiL (CAAX protease family)
VGFLLAQLGAQIMALVAGILVKMVFVPGFLQKAQAAIRAGADPTTVVGVGLLGFTMFCQEVVGVLFALSVLYFIVGDGWTRRIALVTPRLIHVVLAILAMPGMLVLENYVHQGCEYFLPSFHYQASVESFISEFPAALALPIFALGPGIAEELLFRGFIGRGLVARWGFIGGVLFTSFLFGLMHLDPPHIVATTVMGVILHYVYLTGRSIWLPMLMHMLNNGMAVLAVKKVPPFDTVEEVNPWALAASLLLLIAVAWALYDSRAKVIPDMPDDWHPPLIVPDISGGWHPPFLGVECPPEGAAARIGRHRPSWMSGLAVVGALASLVLAIWLK